MSRQLIAWLLIVLMIVGLAGLLARLRYYSRANILRRQRRAEQQRWARRLGDPDDSARIRR